jgi:hypothetical protein
MTPGQNLPGAEDCAFVFYGNSYPSRLTSP